MMMYMDLTTDQNNNLYTVWSALESRMAPLHNPHYTTEEVQGAEEAWGDFNALCDLYGVDRAATYTLGHLAAQK